MIETNEPRITEKPAWFDIPEKKIYWVCTGKSINLEKMPQSETYTSLFYSKEDAETSASLTHQYWEWDRKDASPRTLSESMKITRKSGRAGVRVRQWQDGQFIIVFQYEANQPLPEHLRD
jgi:hypothetical protein